MSFLVNFRLIQLETDLRFEISGELIVIGTQTMANADVAFRRGKGVIVEGNVEWILHGSVENRRIGEGRHHIKWLQCAAIG